MGLFSSIGKAIGSITGGDILGAAGGILGGVGSYAGQTSANAANKDIAKMQMDFQREMSNTAYQRSMKDMRAAGLNPMLAYQQGGASSPAGASATMQDAVTPAINSALSSKRTSAEVQNMKASNKNIEEQNKAIRAGVLNTKSSTELNKALKVKAAADSLLSTSSAKVAASNAALNNLQIPVAAASAGANSSWMARQLNHVDRFMSTLGRFNPLTPSRKK